MITKHITSDILTTLLPKTHAGTTLTVKDTTGSVFTTDEDIPTVSLTTTQGTAVVDTTPGQDTKTTAQVIPSTDVTIDPDVMKGLNFRVSIIVYFHRHQT